MIENLTNGFPKVKVTIPNVHKDMLSLASVPNDKPCSEPAQNFSRGIRKKK